ncbi:MAG: thioredoxin [Rhodobacteraceae bacterium]|nr:MAG: thioredoxin [Paracoccaceae bacterium]
MRLTCPNCGAQYEVPDEVIPDEGRDVQCSNCGDTWYQAHPDFPELALEAEADLAPAPPSPAPKPARDPDPDADPNTDTLRGALSGQDASPPAEPETATPQEPQEREKREMSEGIANILREEAERESHLRNTGDADPLESQPNLGLDDLPDDEPNRRAQEARARMARMRGQPAPAPGAKEGAGSRRDMLPDIEEINSTLRASDGGTSLHTALGPIRVAKAQNNRGGFARGFALIMLLGVILAMVYGNAANISKSVPQAEPALTAYVSAVNQARVWLDAQIGSLLPRPGGPDS